MVQWIPCCHVARHSAYLHPAISGALPFFVAIGVALQQMGRLLAWPIGLLRMLMHRVANYLVSGVMVQGWLIRTSTSSVLKYPSALNSAATIVNDHCQTSQGASSRLKLTD